MASFSTNPTPHDDVNRLLRILLENVRTILGEQFVGMYLFGSLALGDFDRASDIDVAVLTENEITAEQFASLRAMHIQLGALDSPWADQMEVSYLSRRAVRRYDPKALHPQLERNRGETLRMENHFRVVERFVLRERGIVLVGPPLRELIEPVSQQDLQNSMMEMFKDWIVPLVNAPGANPFHSRGDQSYTVLSLCRVLYTLEFGEIVSKRLAAEWALSVLGENWRPLIERALQGRQIPQLPCEQADADATLALARRVMERAERAN